MEPNKDFNQNMNHLVELLKKMISSLPFPTKDAMGKFQHPEGPINVNFCFFNFLPMSPEEMEEFEEMYGDFLAGHEEKNSELKPELTLADIEFLKRYGIRF